MPEENLSFISNYIIYLTSKSNLHSPNNINNKNINIYLSLLNRFSNNLHVVRLTSNVSKTK